MTREQMIDAAVRLARRIWQRNIIGISGVRNFRPFVELKPGVVEMIRAEFRRIAAG